MASLERIKKINELIKRELGKIILRKNNFPKSILVTLTKVETSSDLSESKVFIFVIPKVKTEEVLGEIKHQIYTLQQFLNKRLRMRPVPKIKFVSEKELENAGKIEAILDKIKKNQTK